MEKPSSPTLCDRIERLSRLASSDARSGGLNASQMAALRYLAQANRFSRSPSQVADYLAATRGTVSQTLKALLHKGLVEERRSDGDKRSISYGLTAEGQDAAGTVPGLETSLRTLSAAQRDEVSKSLDLVLETLVAANGGKRFGQCLSCRFHEQRDDGGYCGLLKVPLLPNETMQICAEHQSRPAT